MDRVKLATALMVILILALIGLEMYLNKSFTELDAHAQRIYDLVTRGDWFEAMKEANSLKDKYIEIEKKCFMFIHHHNLKDIESSIERTLIYIKNQDYLGYLLENSNLTSEIKHLKDEEIPVFKNIF
ncbi:MAG: DUF4363 family protein [Clostridiaceae bacterium]|nr:DUF4363 family protein [Clostridiaceae bacterium]